MSKDFLEDYCLFNSGNEAAPTYHMWCGLSALSAIVSKRVWIDMGYFNVYPNLYVVLVGPPGVKKTTAMSSAKGMVRKLGDIPFSAECQTKESLVRELMGYERSIPNPNPEKPAIVYTPISIFVTELSHFLGPNSGHMIDFLTKVYDQEFYDTKTKNKGSDIIKGPYVTLLACTTPDWITTYLKTDIISGGFSRRCIFVLEYNDGEPIPFPTITAEQRAAWERAEEHAYKLKGVCGQFQWEPAAKTYWEEWYVEHKKKVKQGDFDATVRGFESTKDVQILKIAMLLKLASYDFDLVMTKEYLETAIAMFDLLGQNLPKVFQGMGRNELNAVSAKIMDMLRQTGGPIPEKRLQASMYREANGQELYNILNHLQSTDQIVRANQKNSEGALVRTWIALKEHQHMIPGLQ